IHRARDGQSREVGDGESIDLYRQALRSQPLALANRACGRGHESKQPFAIALGRRFFQILFEEAEHTAKTEARRLLLVRSVEEQVLDLWGELFKRSRKIDLVSRGNDLHHPPQVGRAGTRTQRAVEQWFRPIDDDLGWIKVILAAQAVAFGASA